MNFQLLLNELVAIKFFNGGFKSVLHNILRGEANTIICRFSAFRRGHLKRIIESEMTKKSDSLLTRDKSNNDISQETFSQ